VKSDNLPFSLLAALLIGITQMFVIVWFWAGMTLYVQHVPWLLSHGVTGTSLRLLLFFFDNTINLALCLPAAFALRALRPRKLWLYLALAVIPGFLWQSRLLLTDTAWFSYWTIFVPGALMELLTLPVAVLIARSLATRRAA
jgi:hypothetical protein